MRVKTEHKMWYLKKMRPYQLLGSGDYPAVRCHQLAQRVTVILTIMSLCHLIRWSTWTVGNTNLRPPIEESSKSTVPRSIIAAFFYRCIMYIALVLCYDVVDVFWPVRQTKTALSALQLYKCTLVFSSQVNSHIVSCNRVLLLHGIDRTVLLIPCTIW